MAIPWQMKWVARLSKQIRMKISDLVIGKTGVLKGIKAGSTVFATDGHWSDLTLGVCLEKFSIWDQKMFLCIFLPISSF